MTVTLDLNNFVIDRDLLDENPRPAGYVLKNEGTLTITDSSWEKLGAITGGSEGVMETVPVGRGAVYLLPDCDFTASAGQIFTGVWKVEQLDSPDGTDDEAAEVEVGKEITVKKRYVRLTAVWEEISEDTVIIKSANVEFRGKILLKLDTPHTFTVTDGTDTYTITASALSYAYTSVKNGDSDRQNLGKALYLYNQAADAHFVS